MNFLSLTLSDYILILGATILFGTAIKVLITGLKSYIHNFFALSLFFLGSYVVSNFAIDYSNSYQASFTWVRLSSISIILFAASLLYFSRSFTSNRKNNSKIISFEIIPILASCIFSFSRLTIKGIDQSTYPVGVIKGDFYYLLVIIVLILAFSAFVNIIHSYKSGLKFEKYQIKYILTGFLISLCISGFTNILLPALGQSGYLRIGPGFMVIFGLMSGYALVSTNLSDLKILILRGSFFVIAVSIYYAFYSRLYIVLDYKYGSIYKPNPLIIALTLSLIGVYILFEIKNVQEKFISNLDRLKRLNTASKINEIFIKNVPLYETLEYVENQIKSGFQAKFVKINLFPQKFKERNKLSRQIISHDSITIRHLRNEKVSKKNIEMLEDMDKNNTDLIVPIYLRDEILGTITLGDKIIQAPYTKNELNFIQDISKTISIGIKKILLFTEVENFNLTLKNKVRIATKKLRKQKAQLQEKYQFERDMMGIMGHELRTPLTVAKGNSELLLAKAKGNIPMNSDYIADKVDSIHDSILKEADLIQTMLSTSHIDNNKLNFQLGPVNLEECINYAVMAFTKEADKKKLSLKYDKPDFVVPEIMSDSSRTQEVVTNLVSNAVKYTARGYVKIYLEKTNESLIVHVKDSGIGIPKEEIENIGKKFYRIHQHLDKEKEIVRAGGTGLGLYVVKGILEGLGGELQIESVEGEGSIFSAVFPYQAKVEDNIVLKPRRNEENDLFKVLKFPKNQKPIILKRTQE